MQENLEKQDKWELQEKKKSREVGKGQNGCKWPQIAANGCKWLQMAENS